jgi:hypothetical protein
MSLTALAFWWQSGEIKGLCRSRFVAWTARRLDAFSGSNWEKDFGCRIRMQAISPAPSLTVLLPASWVAFFVSGLISFRNLDGFGGKSMKGTIRIIGLMLSVALLMAPTASAQSTATLSGTVRDASGGVIPGVDITVTNQSSGDLRKTVTNQEGYFAIPLLPVGTYKLTAALTGFTTYQATDIALTASDSKSVNIDLKVGQVSEIVEVSATVNEVAVVDSGEKSTLITAKDLQDMTLLSRNAAEVVKMMPGATMSANCGKNQPGVTGTIGINGYTIGGNAAGLGGTNINGQSLDITMDGGHIFDPGASGSATPVNPNTDMISEVKVLTSNFSAEAERGPVVVNVVTKSGGKDFHGEAYLYARHNAMNANDAFVKSQGQPRQEDKYFYPGAQIGGPLIIPGTGFNKSREKLFFFNGFEYYKQTVAGGLARAVVPVPANYLGDFSPAQEAGLGSVGNLNGVPSIVDTTWLGERPGCTITNGVLSQGCIDPNGLKLLKAYLPAPNADPRAHNGYNFVWGVLTPQNSWQNLTRVDWNLSNNTKVFARYSVQRETSNQPLGLWGGTGGDSVIPSPTNILGEYRSDSVSASLTHVFSPTMTSETTYAYTFEGMPNRPEDLSKLMRKEMGLTITGVYGNPQAPAFTAWGTAFPNMGSGNNLGADYHPGMIADKGMPSVTENFSKVWSTHSLKFGAFYEHIYNKQDNWGQYPGVFQMPQGWGTGVNNNYADILMGITSGQMTEQQLPPATQISENILSLYAQDRWKLNRRLTVEYGIRFEHYAKPYAASDLGLATFFSDKYSNDPAKLNAHTGVLWHGIDNSVPSSGTTSRLFYFSPRLGAAWDLFGNAKTVLRGGWGKYRTYDSLQSNSYVGPVQTGMGATSYYCNAWSCPTFEDIDKAATNHPLPAGLPAGLVSVNVMDPKNDEQPLVTTYSFSINQKLPSAFYLEASYVGNHSRYLQQQPDVNSLPVGKIPLSTYLPAISNGGSFNHDPYRPRTNYQSIYQSVTAGKAKYDSLQVSLKRSVGWLNLTANYTWGKNFSDLVYSGAYADYGESVYYGISPQNRAHVFSMSYVINLPKVKGSNAFVRGLGSDWQISGITQIQSGANLTSQNISLQYGQDNLVDANGVVLKANDAIGKMGTDGLTLMPRIVCNPVVNEPVTYTVGGKSYSGVRYLNPACFAPAADGTAGTTNMPYLPGPKFVNSDLSLAKNFKLTERQRLQFKLQMFNFLNHPLQSFQIGDNNLAMKFDADGTMKNPTGGASINTFGVANYQFGHRTLELMLKYSF